MFFKRRGRAKPAAPAEPEPPRPSRSDQDLMEAAFDTVAALLRAYGAHAFDTETMPADQLAARCEAWAQHLLVGAAEPGGTALAGVRDEPPGRQATPPRRNWNGARSFFASNREAEVRFVDEGMASLRDAIWAFIQALSQTVRTEKGEDSHLLRQMQRLKTSVDRNQPNEIRNQALATVELVREVVAERGDRQRKQVAALGARVETMRERLNQAREMASVDQLTGLFNRAAFDAHVEQVVDLGRVFGRSACLLLVDVDHFKWVNDHHGHQAGDAVLRALGECLAEVFLRKADFVARYGGEEFAVVLDAEELDGALIATERMLETIRALDVDYNDQRLRITASVGVSRLVPGEDGAGWIERADRALYEAKEAGRDRIQVEPRPE